MRSLTRRGLASGLAGTAGMGNYRFFFTGGSNDETLNGILGAAYWFTPRFATFHNQATRLPIDQHSLGALVAPRPLLITNGTEGSDIRTNPQGAGLSSRAAQMVPPPSVLRPSVLPPSVLPPPALTCTSP